jgi:hypothetical protein
VPAPRVCRDCGAALSPDVRWCTECFQPITEFAARERSAGSTGTPIHDVRSTRWKKAGPLSFGPLGRVLITIFVLLMGPSTVSFFSLMYLPVWLGVSVVVLKQVWRRMPLAADEPPTTAERFRERHPTLGFRFDARSIAIVGGALLLIGLVVLMLLADTAGFYALVGVCSILGLAVFIAWVADV